METYLREGRPTPADGKTWHWDKCKKGHDLNDPATYYEDNHGHRRCRECQREKMRAFYRNTKFAADSTFMRRKLHPENYRRWARTHWELMTPKERALVAFGLEALPLGDDQG